MSDVEKLCWANAARKKWADEIAAEEDARNMARAERYRKEQLSIRRALVVKFVQRMSWMALGAASALVMFCAAGGRLDAALAWSALGSCSIVSIVLSEGMAE